MEKNIDMIAVEQNLGLDCCFNFFQNLNEVFRIYQVCSLFSLSTYCSEGKNIMPFADVRY